MEQGARKEEIEFWTEHYLVKWLGGFAMLCFGRGFPISFKWLLILWTVITAELTGHHFLPFCRHISLSSFILASLFTTSHHTIWLVVVGVNK